MMTVVAVGDRRGNVSAGQIHPHRAVLQGIRSRHARAVDADVVRVAVKERQRAGQLGLFVDHLEKIIKVQPCSSKWNCHLSYANMLVKPS